MSITLLSAIALRATSAIASVPVGRMGSEEVGRDPGCKCLPWDAAYSVGAAHCGQGQEMFAWAQTSGLSWDQVLPFARREVCTEFFEKFRHDACVNVDAGAHSAEWRGAQWCYVSPFCGDLNGGSRVSNSVSWKVCRRVEDTLLQDLYPLELVIFAEEQELDLGYLAKLAYPLEDQLWHEVEHLWWPGLTQSRTSEAFDVPKQLMQVAMRAEPVIYEVQMHSRESLVIVVGDSIWAMVCSGEMRSKSSCRLMCIVGCHETRRFSSIHDESSLTEARVVKMSDAVPIDNANPKVSASDGCKCLNWKDAYASGRAKCGQGLELSTPMQISGLSQKQLPPVLQHELCTDFFAAQDHQTCIHVNAGPAAGEPNSMSWCYVPSTCDGLKGRGLASTGTVSWKMCLADEDAISWSYAIFDSSTPLLQPRSIIENPELVSTSQESSAWYGASQDMTLRGSRRALDVAAEAKRAIQVHGPFPEFASVEETRGWVFLRSGTSPGTAFGRCVVWMISYLPWLVGLCVLAIKAAQVARQVWSQALDDLSSLSPVVFVFAMKEILSKLHIGLVRSSCWARRTDSSQQATRSSVKTARVDWDRLVRLHIDKSSAGE